MTDSKLRELERRFRQSGAVEAEAAWLRERLRQGDLSADRLRLAAFLEHPAAVDALDDPGAPPARWLKGLEPFGREALERAAVACACSELADLDEPELTARLERGEQALLTGTGRRALWDPWLVGPGPQGRSRRIRAERAVRTALLVIGSVTKASLGYARTGLTTNPSRARRDAIARELVPWALGYSDPVRERVEARRREAGGE